MPRAKQTFRRTDLMRTIKAARDAGLVVSEVRISPGGEITLHTDATEPVNKLADEPEVTL
jgi:hypothetical protein